jgi:hypothetical protein
MPTKEQYAADIASLMAPQVATASPPTNVVDPNGPMVTGDFYAPSQDTGIASTDDSYAPAQITTGANPTYSPSGPIARAPMVGCVFRRT